jgi:hypothetical protein
MRTCPDILFQKEVKSTAEEKVFRLLEQVNLGDDWCAYHSLNCSQHEYKRWSELDFVLVGPEGVFVLEVKGGRIRREGGTWFYKDRYGQEHRNNEGPFAQARTGMYALKDLLLKEYGVPPKNDESILFGWGVVFPDIIWNEETVENPKEVVCAQPDQTVAGVEAYLRRLIKYWLSKENRPPTLIQKETLNLLRKRLRPSIDFVPPLSTRLGEALQSLQYLTDEQEERIHTIEANERVIVSGGAGTGKTYLAVQLARRMAIRGKKVLFVVESPELASWLRRMETDRRISILTCARLDSISSQFDALIVDEGQDMLDCTILDRLGSLIIGGLDEGNWCWFMDDVNQANLRGTFDPDALSILEHGLSTGLPTRLPLRNNVRNTKEIVEAVKGWINADIGQPSVKGSGRNPTVIGVRDESDLTESLVRTLDDLDEEGVSRDQIAILLAQECRPGILDSLPRRVRSRLAPLDPTTAKGVFHKKILWGSVSSFKGFERPIVICIGFTKVPKDPVQRAEFYVATTRANFGLYLFVPSVSVASFLLHGQPAPNRLNL